MNNDAKKGLGHIADQKYNELKEELIKSDLKQMKTKLEEELNKAAKTKMSHDEEQKRGDMEVHDRRTRLIAKNIEYKKALNSLDSTMKDKGVKYEHKTLDPQQVESSFKSILDHLNLKAIIKSQKESIADLREQDANQDSNKDNKRSHDGEGEESSRKK